LLLQNFQNTFLIHLFSPLYCVEQEDKVKSYQDGINRRDKKCHLKTLGNKYAVDKVDSSHRYQGLYCTLFEPIRHFSLDMLEIGFGCGHHVHGRSALMWNRYLFSFF
jgi:hypothetical protein